jgi:hypothetical protein
MSAQEMTNEEGTYRGRDDARVDFGGLKTFDGLLSFRKPITGFTT